MKKQENKISIKKVFVIAIVLMLFAGLSGVIVVIVNSFTADIITENEKKLEQNSLTELYGELNYVVKENDIVDVDENGNETGATYIQKVYSTNYNSDEYYIYKVSGKNAYGVITLLVSVDNNGNVDKVIIMENTESYKTKVNDSINKNYQDGDINLDNIDNIDMRDKNVTCGATYGAKLVRTLITKALEHYANNYKGVQE